MFIVNYLKNQGYIYSHHKLWEACRNGSLSDFSYYLPMCQSDSSLNYVRDGCTPLKNAIKVGSLEMTRALLERGCNPHKTEPLLYIVTFGMTDFLELFLEYGVDITVQYSIDETALMMACYFSRLDMVRRLLPHYSADKIRLRDVDGFNCLMYAIQFDNDDIVREILNVCPEIKDDQNYDLKTSYEVARDNYSMASLVALSETVVRTTPQQSVIVDYF